MRTTTLLLVLFSYPRINFGFYCLPWVQLTWEDVGGTLEYLGTHLWSQSYDSRWVVPGRQGGLLAVSYLSHLF